MSDSITPKLRDDRGKLSLLSPENARVIASYIRAGAYAWVACAAAGVPLRTYQMWITRTEPEFVAFQELINQARAQARLAAEISIKKTKPEFWLARGPGKDRPGEPGWSSDDKVQITGGNGGPVQVNSAKLDYSKLTVEELEFLERVATKLALPRGDPSDEGGEES